MTLIDSTSVAPVTAEQVYEIKTMAESGQFADALIRLRKIKPLYPRNTFLVALEKQLERLLVLPRDSEPSESQKKELMASLPGLVQGAVDSLRQQTPSRPQATPTAGSAASSKPERSERDTARVQLKEQYFQHADEYLKKGAYGSALVEIRRVKIIAPDDPTVIEYERTIRQLVELQQRTSIRTQETKSESPSDSDIPRTGVEASPTPAPPVREFDSDAVPPSQKEAPAPPEQTTPQRHTSRIVPFLLIVIGLIVLAVVTLALFSSPEEPMSARMPDSSSQPAAVQPGEAVPTATHEESAQPPAQPEVSTPAAATHEEAAQIEPAQTPEHAVSKVEPVPPQPVAKQGTTPATAPKRPAPASSAPEHTRKSAAAEKSPAATPDSPVESAKPPLTDADPEILHLQQPVFPPEVQSAKAGDEVIIMVQIDPAGKPTKTLIAKSTNPAFNPAITAAAMSSVYKAGTTPNGPTTKWITIPFRIQ